MQDPFRADPWSEEPFEDEAPGEGLDDSFSEDRAGADPLMEDSLDDDTFEGEPLDSAEGFDDDSFDGWDDSLGDAHTSGAASGFDDNSWDDDSFGESDEDSLLDPFEDSYEDPLDDNFEDPFEDNFEDPFGDPLAPDGLEEEDPYDSFEGSDSLDAYDRVVAQSFVRAMDSAEDQFLPVLLGGLGRLALTRLGPAAVRAARVGAPVAKRGAQRMAQALRRRAVPVLKNAVNAVAPHVRTFGSEALRGAGQGFGQTLGTNAAQVLAQLLASVLTGSNRLDVFSEAAADSADNVTALDSFVPFSVGLASRNFRLAQRAAAVRRAGVARSAQRRPGMSARPAVVRPSAVRMSPVAIARASALLRPLVRRYGPPVLRAVARVSRQLTSQVARGRITANTAQRLLVRRTRAVAAQPTLLRRLGAPRPAIRRLAFRAMPPAVRTVIRRNVLRGQTVLAQPVAPGLVRSVPQLRRATTTIVVHGPVRVVRAGQPRRR